jgi:drug/metabolite transporter (DMT)-like permease
MNWFFYALGAAIIWGINYAVAGRLLERGMSPQTLFLIDMVFGAIGMAALLSITGKWQSTYAELQLPRSELAWLSIAVITAMVAALLIFLSIQAKNATVSSLIEVTYPFFTAFFAWMLFRQNTLNLATIIGGLLILAGVVIIARGNN